MRGSLSGSMSVSWPSAARTSPTCLGWGRAYFCLPHSDRMV